MPISCNNPYKFDDSASASMGWMHRALCQRPCGPSRMLQADGPVRIAARRLPRLSQGGMLVSDDLRQ